MAHSIEVEISEITLHFWICLKTCSLRTWENMCCCTIKNWLAYSRRPAQQQETVSPSLVTPHILFRLLPTSPSIWDL